MLRNYFKIAFRNLWRNKTFSFLNILGLTTGTVCCLYILIYVKEQLGFDVHHKEAENIYRLRSYIEFGKDQPISNSCTVSPVIAPTLKKDFAEVQEYTRVLSFFTSKNTIISAEGKNETFTEEKGYLVDSTFFKVFSYRFVEGSPEHSLDAPHTAVLSTEIAQKLFGSGKVLNKRIKIGNNENTSTYTITGVYDEKYGKSHLKPKFLVSLNSGGFGEFARSNTEWAGNNFMYAYVKLNSNANPAKLEAKLPAFLNHYGGKRMVELGMKKRLFLQPITDIHLYSKGITGQVGNVSDISFLYILLTIAAFIQLIACINFVNLTTARSVRRAKEVGIRKAVGAFRSALVGQFLGESLLIAFVAISLALPIVYILLPFLNSLTNSSITIHILQDFDIVFIALVVAFTTGILAGIYPAIYLSNFKPASVLKGTFNFNPASVLLRKGLVVFQFSIAIVLIIGVLVISKQMTFIQNQYLGFNQKQKIVVVFPTNQAQVQFNAFKNELLSQKEVRNLGGVTYYPSTRVLEDMRVFKSGGSMNSGYLIKGNGIESDFFKAMGIELIAGRNFTPADTNNQVILNEKAVEDLKLDLTTVVGTQIFTGSDDNVRNFTVVGVHKNYNNNSLKSGIEPMLTYLDVYPDYAILDVQTQDFASFFAKTERIWKKLIPDAPFQYTFLDDEIQKQYIEEKTLQKIVNSFTVIAILISCLGLFGLAMFTAEQRTKEIGVRKVLGASVLSISVLLSKQFLKPILIALSIASPLAYLAMNNWLQGFVYHTKIEWWIFVLTGILVVAVAVLTVSFQAIKAALANPVKSLRSE